MGGHSLCRMPPVEEGPQWPCRTDSPVPPSTGLHWAVPSCLRGTTTKFAVALMPQALFMTSSNAINFLIKPVNQGADDVRYVSQYPLLV